MHGDMGPHVPDDVLEKYLLWRLSEKDAAPVEEHLLVCPACQARSEEWDEFIAVSRVALRECVRKPAHRAFVMRLGALHSWLPMSVFAGVVAAILITAMLTPPHPVAEADPVELRLYAMRGPGVDLPRVPAHAVLKLDLAAEELPARIDYGVEIVDATGARVWNGAGPRVGAYVSVSVDRHLPTGRYWVRLRRGGELIHEYGLEIR